MNSEDLLIQIKADVDAIKRNMPIASTATKVSDKWIPRSEVMKFLNYGNTQMAWFEKTHDLIITKIGKRKFIHRDSISRLLDKNTIQP
jgi:hypothetical protein